MNAKELLGTFIGPTYLRKNHIKINYSKKFFKKNKDKKTRYGGLGKILESVGTGSILSMFTGACLSIIPGLTLLVLKDTSVIDYNPDTYKIILGASVLTGLATNTISGIYETAKYFTEKRQIKKGDKEIKSRMIVDPFYMPSPGL